MNDLQVIKNISNIRGKKVLMRVDFNVPVDSNNVIHDDFRIKKTIPTIEFLKNAGTKVILLSHTETGTKSLKPAAEYLQKQFPVRFIPGIIDSSTKEKIGDMVDGEVVLLDNLRLNDGEKANDENFAKLLASFGDIYVNEAFSNSHRAHASMVGIPKFIPGYAGILLEQEISNLSKAFAAPHPFLFILGGAKFDTKLPLIKKYLELADTVFVGGALANDFFREMGYETGWSLISEEKFDLANLVKNKKLLLPTDVVVKNEIESPVKQVSAVLSNESIMDIGPDSVKTIIDIAKKAKFILWNGPLGNFEIGFDKATDQLAQALAEVSAETIVGGGDTISAIANLAVEDKYSFLSTGGGAMLDFLLDEKLVAIEALKESQGKFNL